MNLYSIGNLAKSIAGHDKNQIFMILREDERDVYLADGLRRGIENPKRKNKRHVQPVYYKNEAVQAIEKNEDIKRVLKLYKKESQV